MSENVQGNEQPEEPKHPENQHENTQDNTGENKEQQPPKPAPYDPSKDPTNPYFFPPPPPVGDDMVRAITEEIEGFLAQPADNGIFTIKTANEWLEQASKRPIPQMLFAEMWYEGEICILYADTNVGKSILAVQIADSISRGIPVEGFSMTAQAQPVIYFDFELFDKQFENRYSIDYKHHYSFHTNLQRAEINPDNTVPEGYEQMEDYLHDSIATAIQNTGARVLIIDNITYLRQETERAKDALPLMKHLKALKLEYNLSILALAHTPKRDQSKPLTLNDLQGSKMLMNFCDSSFCIGASTQDKQLRYLKQVKMRSTEHIYHDRNVALCRIEKPHNFLRFSLIGYGNEYEHLKSVEEDERTHKIAEVKRLIDEEGLSQREVADILGISTGTVSKYYNL